MLLLVVLGAVFTLMMGSFAGYHAYLISTNQTTIEQLSPFLLLRALPAPLPPAQPAHADPYYFPSPSQPLTPAEHELTYKQRRLVQRAHERLRLYDLGLARNWAAVFGVPDHAGKRPRWQLWAARVLWGGGAACVGPAVSRGGSLADCAQDGRRADVPDEPACGRPAGRAGDAAVSSRRPRTR